MISTLPVSIPVRSRDPLNDVERERRFTSVSAGSIYLRDNGSIYSLVDGSVLWTSAHAFEWGRSDYAGGFVGTIRSPEQQVYIEQP